jgi:hypothetical protein
MRHNLLRTVSLLLILKANCLWAIPELQLDIVGGTYDPITQTTIANSPIFTLRALDWNNEGSATAPTGTYYVSVAIVPGLAYSSTTPDFGSVTVNSTAYSYTSSAWNWGSPPVDVADNSSGTGPGNLAPHGVFPTYYLELAFTFDSLHSMAAYNVADGSSASGSVWYKDFSVDVTGLLPAYAVHFDLYNEKMKKGSYTINDFAPFSHDAESGHNVPEGGLTLLLLGLGLTGLATFQWKSRRQTKSIVERT